MPLPKFYGIKKGYPRLYKHFGKLVTYIQLCRVFTGFAPLMAGLFGTLAPVQSITFEHMKTAIFVGVTLMMCQFCGQVINQYSDYELDKIIKPYRALPSGLVSREEALGLSWLLAIFAVGRAFTISTFFGLITLILIFFAIYYSLAPFSPRKIHPMLNMSWMAVSRGLLPMLAVWSVAGSLSRALPYSLLAFLWVMGFQGSKDTPDVEGDRKFGIKTVPGVYGLRGLTALMVICSIAYSIMALYFQISVMLLVLPLAIIAVLTTKKQSTLTENTYAWTAFYSGLAIIYILMFINERISF